jgi:alpha-1,3-glucan synthase
MELYPDRVYSKPEFTALPPYLFSGADFALIPSRDEPFGLVAVEFGRKGALGVGSRLGGLGLMPGWVRPTLRLIAVLLITTSVVPCGV